MSDKKIKPVPTALHTKYRPSEFTELVGQDHVIQVIQSQLDSQTLPNCLILYGPPGVGKTSLGRLIAKALNPSEHGLIEKDSALEGGKDVIRELQSTIYNKPFIGEYKVYLFDEAHEISKSGFASLLKITEEPPAHVKFIFVTTEFDKIPANIKSRCQSHSLNRLSNQVIRNRIKEVIKVEKLDIPDTLISLVVDAASGSLRNAIVHLETVIASYSSGNTELNIAKTLGILGSKRLSDFVSSYVFEDFKKLDSLIEMFYPDSTDLSLALSNLQQFVIDARYAVIIPGFIETSKSDVVPFLTELDLKLKDKPAKDHPALKAGIGRKLDQFYDLTLDLETNLRRTSNKEASLRRFVIKLAQSWN